jgi:hypothetical protein
VIVSILTEAIPGPDVSLVCKALAKSELNGWVVSAAGLEPATHALKGHCSTN